MTNPDTLFLVQLLVEISAAVVILIVVLWDLIPRQRAAATLAGLAERSRRNWRRVLVPLAVLVMGAACVTLYAALAIDGLARCSHGGLC